MFRSDDNGTVQGMVAAGLASAVMGDLSLLPPYVARFYEELFDAPVR